MGLFLSTDDISIDLLYRTVVVEKYMERPEIKAYIERAPKGVKIIFDVFLKQDEERIKQALRFFVKIYRIFVENKIPLHRMTEQEIEDEFLKITPLPLSLKKYRIINSEEEALEALNIIHVSSIQFERDEEIRRQRYERAIAREIQL